MKLRNLVLMVFCAAVVGVFVASCGVDEKASEATDDDDRLAEVVRANGGEMAGDIDQSSSPAKDHSQNANGAGQCCWGHCTSSEAFLNRTLSEGCRAWVVNVCHANNQAFLPNGDAWWGTCL
jgi:hypothetical protein